MTEVLHEPVHHWSSNMIDARVRQAEQSYCPPSHAHRAHSRHDSTTSTTPSARSSHSPSRSVSVRSSASHQSRAPSASHELPPSPPLQPTTGTDVEQATSAVKDVSMNDTASSVPHGDHPASPTRIRIRDLQHIQDIAVKDSDSFSPNASDTDSDTATPQYVISDMPVGDIIEMVAGLLTKITSTNDQHYEHLHRSIPAPDSASALSPQTTSVLAFHGKNVPSITILSYLARIQKYCPATYEVFLSLLVYFDRMTERVNSGHMISLRQANQESIKRARSCSRDDMEKPAKSSKASFPSPPSSNPMSPQVQRQNQPNLQEPPSPPLSDSDPTNLSHFFVVDSFNIHRLVIAGVTCAAKFFSDVFFTNSRYAKVGGLPLLELNHLELQFLLLNDFRLAIPVEELDQYATMLVEFYAREVAAQRHSDNMQGVS